ncbi:hypothetical protein NPIL_627341 [Nephila pilipes]|uniref:Uncharacterized protein n=1 Tax=Nephila pilipes TaxID=299642 RepID=A0A8X6TDB4_NEPPI|nr:hypothetical protein NPIL_627341 [Nephila pilipes]
MVNSRSRRHHWRFSDWRTLANGWQHRPSRRDGGSAPLEHNRRESAIKDGGQRVRGGGASQRTEQNSPQRHRCGGSEHLNEHNVRSRLCL